MATFKDRLDEAMQARGITAAELSRLAQVNEGAISQYRAGKYKASQRSLDKLAKALNVNIAWLMGADVPMNDITAGTEPPASTPDLVAAEANPFFRILEDMDYYVNLAEDREGYYIRKNCSDFHKFMTVEEFKSFVRSSKATIAALLNSMTSDEDSFS